MRTQTSAVIVRVVCFLILVTSGATAHAEPAAPSRQSSEHPARIGGWSGQSAQLYSGNPVSRWFPISPINNVASHKHEWHPSVTYNSLWQEYLAVWDQSDDSGGNYVYGQFVSRSGTLIGSRFLIPGVSGVNASPDVAYNPARNEYLVVFQYSQTPSRGIIGQRLDALGAPVGTQIIFASSTTYSYQDAAVAYETDTAQYLVAWQKAQGTAFSGIETRALSGDGATLSTIIEITAMLASVWPEKPDVACTRTLDECLVVWQRWSDSSQTHHDIYGQRIHIAGGAHLEGVTFAILYAANDEARPSVAAIARTTGIGQYLVVGAYNDSGTWYTVGQSLTDTGALDQWIQIGASNGGHPSVAGNENTQEYLVAWPTPAGTDMRARTVSTLGSLGAIALAQPPGAAPIYPAIAAGPLGDYLVTCQDYYSGYPTDIFGFLWGNRAYLPLILKP